MAVQTRSSPVNVVLDGLSDARRRRILRLLYDRNSTVSLRELATHLVALENDEELVEATEAEVERMVVDLVHTQLPKLADTDLVAWNEREETVATTDHPALPDPKLQRIVDTDAEGWDAVLSNLSHKRRRVVLSVLKDAGEPLTRSEIAREVAVRDASGSERPAEAEAEISLRLRHVHLPKLADAGLVSCDAEADTATYEGHPELDDEWLDARLHETPRAILPTARSPDDVWTIEGRDNVIARGQSLFEQAEDELFLMFTTGGLLEDGCIRRLQDAIDRGVDVYLGSQTPEVRDLVRERVPEAVVWEPQMDWLNLPPEYEKVGRLVFADQEAIMLATLGEETDAGAHAETAITGSGENNPLVVLLRDMLGSRLEHLDAQSEDFLAEIPL